MFEQEILTWAISQLSETVLKFDLIAINPVDQTGIAKTFVLDVPTQKVNIVYYLIKKANDVFTPYPINDYVANK